MVKMLVLPNVLCKISVVPASYFVDINKLILKFKWKGKRPKIANRILKKNEAEGLILQTLRLSVKLQWSRQGTVGRGWGGEFGWRQSKDLKRPRCWERLKAGGEGNDRGQNVWMASSTQRKWIWANPRRQCRTGKPGTLQTMGSQRVRHDWVTEWQQWYYCLFFTSLSSCRCVVTYLGLASWFSGKESTCQCSRHRRPGFSPWAGKIP